MSIGASFLSLHDRQQADQNIYQLKGFPDFNLPKIGLADLDSKRTATQTGNLFAALPVALTGLLECSDMILPCIAACSGSLLNAPPTPYQNSHVPVLSCSNATVAGMPCYSQPMAHNGVHTTQQEDTYTSQVQ